MNTGVISFLAPIEHNDNIPPSPYEYTAGKSGLELMSAAQCALPYPYRTPNCSWSSRNTLLLVESCNALQCMHILCSVTWICNMYN